MVGSVYHPASMQPPFHKVSQPAATTKTKTLEDKIAEEEDRVNKKTKKITRDTVKAIIDEIRFRSHEATGKSALNADKWRVGIVSYTQDPNQTDPEIRSLARAYDVWRINNSKPNAKQIQDWLKTRLEDIVAPREFAKQYDASQERIKIWAETHGYY